MPSLGYFYQYLQKKEQTLEIDIMLVVRVPVLSLQMTVVHPSVSTEGSVRTIAFSFAILFVPSAKQLNLKPKQFRSSCSSFAMGMLEMGQIGTSTKVHTAAVCIFLVVQ